MTFFLYWDRRGTSILLYLFQASQYTSSDIWKRWENSIQTGYPLTVVIRITPTLSWILYLNYTTLTGFSIVSANHLPSTRITSRSSIQAGLEDPKCFCLTCEMVW